MTTGKTTPSLHATVSGRVQGVYFRAWVREQATGLALRGWVRNLADGRVELLAQGEPEALAALRERLPKGPPLSRVDGVDAATIEHDTAYDAFSIRG